MNYRLNVGWKYQFAKTQEEWDMIDRAAIIEECAKALYGYARVIPDDAPTWEEADEETREHLRGGARTVLAAVPPAQTDRAANRTPVERLRAVLETQSSPTIDRGDSHGARGQKGWIVWESSLPFIAADLAAVPSAPTSSDTLAVELARLISSVSNGLTAGSITHRRYVLSQYCVDNATAILVALCAQNNPAPPSIPERDMVLEALKVGRYCANELMELGEAYLIERTKIETAIAALEGK